MKLELIIQSEVSQKDKGACVLTIFLFKPFTERIQ